MAGEFKLLDELADRAALKDEVEYIKGLLREVNTEALNTAKLLKAANIKFDSKDTGITQLMDGMKSLNLTTSNYQKVLAAVAENVEQLTEEQKAQLRTINDVYKAEENLRSGAKETVNLIKTEITLTNKLDAGRSEIAKTIARQKEQLRQENLERTRLASVLNAENNSRQKAQAIIDLLINKGKKLNLETEQGRRVNEAYNKTIAKQNEFILKTADVETQRIKNVGQYPKSAQIIVDALEKERKKLQELEQQKIRVQNAGAPPLSGAAAGSTGRTVVAGFGGGGGASAQMGAQAKEAAMQINNLDKEIEQSRTIVEGFARITDNPKFLNISAKVGDATQEVKFFTKSLIEMERQGLGNSAAAKELRKNLAEMTDEISDAKAEIKALSSDTRSFDLFAGSVSFAADAFQTFAGAAVLAGASEEDAAEATKTLVAVQSVANGVKGIANELTTRGTAANKLFAFSQAQLSTAIDSTASAGARLRAVMLTLGFGAIIVGIGLLIANWEKVKNVMSGVTKQQAMLNATQAEYKKGATEAIKSVIDVRVAFDLARKGVITKKEALQKYNDTLGDAFGKTNDLTQAEKNLTDKAEAYIRITGLKAQANALFAMSAEETAKAVLASEEDQTSVWDNLKIGALNNIGAYGIAIKTKVDAQNAGVKSAVKEANNAADLLKLKGEELLKEAGNLAKTSGINTDLVGNNEVKAKPEKKVQDDRVKNAIEAEKRKNDAIRGLLIENANDRIRINQEISDDEGKQVGIRMNAEKQALTFKKSLALIEYEAAIEAEKTVEDGKLKIIEKSAEQKLLAKTIYENKINALTTEFGKKQIEIIKQNDEKKAAQLAIDQELELSVLTEAKEKEMAQMEIAYNNDITALNKRYTDGKISQEQYNEDREKLDEAYHIAALKKEIEYTKKVLEVLQLRGADVKQQMRDLAALEMELSDITKERVVKNEEEKEEKVMSTIEKIQAAYSVLGDIVSGALDISFTKQKDRIQQELTDVDKRKEAELKANEQKVQSEQDKANAIIMINARAAAQKEELEKRQKQIERQKAQADKAMAIFQIIISTAVNAAKAANPFMKALALVSGAAQLAIAMATPLPKFKHGLKHDYEGPAIVGDGGKSEAIIRKDGSIEITPASDTLTYLEHGDRIDPDAEHFLNSVKGSAMRDVAMTANGKTITEQDYAAMMVQSMSKKIEQQNQILERIANKKELHLEASNQGMLTMHKWAASEIKYISEQTNWTV